MIFIPDIKSFILNLLIELASFIINKFHNPRTKLELSVYKTNTGIEQYIIGNNKKYNIQFNLLSNKLGYFKLSKIDYKPFFAINTKKKVETIYDIYNNINELPNNDYVAEFTNRIYVTMNHPSKTFSFDYSKVINFKRGLEKNTFTKDNKIFVFPSDQITPGNLICKFITNDKKQKEIKCTI